MIACKDNHDLETFHYHLKSTDTCSHPDSSNVTKIYDTKIDITTTGVSKHSNGHLSFVSMAAFETIMSEIVNNSTSKLDDWENAIHFTSRRSHMNYLINQMSANPDTLFRVEDKYFETVLDTLNRIAIGDTLYTYDWSSRIVSIKPPDASSYTENLTLSYQYDATCNTDKWYAEEKFYGDNKKLTCYKWRSYYVVYSSMGIDINSRKQGIFNWWYPHSVDIITAVIDQWHEVEWYYQAFPAQIFTLTNTSKEVTNESDLTWVIAYFVNGATQICTPKFERFHFFKDDYYNDGHHNTNSP